ncbi:hypothetical protein ACU8KH_04303 [Lachancea thermotolerans]
MVLLSADHPYWPFNPFNMAPWLREFLSSKTWHSKNKQAHKHNFAESSYITENGAGHIE